MRPVKLFLLAMSTFLCLSLMPMNIVAQDGIDKVNVAVSNVTLAKNEYAEDEAVTGVKFNLDIVISDGLGFKAGQEFKFNTNIKDIFDANWSRDFKNIAIVDGGNKIVSNYSLNGGSEFVIKIDSTSDKAAELHAVIELPKMYVKNFGDEIKQGSSKEVNLTIKDQKVGLKINGKQDVSVGGNGGTIDMNQLWKNAFTLKKDSTGSVTMIEVNPIASLDLYTGLKKPVAYEYFIVEDKIEDKGIIDESTLQIYAAVPTYKKATENKRFGDYFIPKDEYYAQREGTMRYFLDRPYGSYTKSRLARLNQTENETYAEFYERIKAKPLSFGIYEDTEHNQTFVCNFGGIGNADSSKNNGITYNDYTGLGNDYPAVFGSEGPTKGNIVSYYIEFNTYFPEIVGSKPVNNTATYKSNLNGHVGGHGNTATFTIDNSKPNSIGFVKKSDLSILVVNETNSKPIANAEFKLYRFNLNDELEQMPLEYTLKSNENGRVYVRSLPTGKYKIVQVSTEEGYEFTNDNYGESGINPEKAKNVSENGVFEVKLEDKCGHATIVTNSKNFDEVPVIVAKDFEVIQNSDYNPFAGLVRATDEEDGNLKEDVKVVDNNVKIDKVGEYTLTYQVTDSYGNTTKKTIKVTVKAEKDSSGDNQKPTKPDTKPSHKEENNKNEFIVVNTATK